MKRLFFVFVLIGCMTFSSMVFATGGDSTTPTVDAILNGDNGESGLSTDVNLDNPSVEPATESASTEDTTVGTTEEGEIYNPMEYIDQELFPSHSLTEVGSKATKKGFELVKLVQIVGYIIVTVVFIIAIVAIAINKGTGGNHSNAVGWGALIVCVICYILIFIGPSLLEWFKNWAVS